MTTSVYFWLSVSLLFMVFELGNPGLFYFLSFSLGAFITACASGACDMGYVSQIIIFLLGTLVSIGVLRRWLHSKMFAKPVHTNVDALIGKQAVVIVTIQSDLFGQVKIGGELWSARSVGNHEIAQGEIVAIKHVRGAHVVVEKISNQ